MAPERTVTVGNTEGGINLPPQVLSPHQFPSPSPLYFATRTKYRRLHYYVRGSSFCRQLEQRRCHDENYNYNDNNNYNYNYNYNYSNNNNSNNNNNNNNDNNNNSNNCKLIYNLYTCTQ